ncbi:hypothetical protein [Chthonomonas calidirosea]|uniref:hypothetical protein n=1 Tax=Chthonomonas calidirosea TaxID=454171 RepID=UPI0006EC5C2E|nr:hypothetical protein [Chthonomonas calidirosea]CEK13241.1 hypothetical protein CP488_00433 [Chthonomonas calidirosea]
MAALFAYPVGQKPCYYLTGEYDRPLEFEFEGKKLTGDAVDLEGRRLKPGDEWEEPQPRILYVLKAGGMDIYYEWRFDRKLHGK